MTNCAECTAKKVCTKCLNPFYLLNNSTGCVEDCSGDEGTFAHDQLYKCIECFKVIDYCAICPTN